MHAWINDGLVGPHMEASHVSVLARICMWPKKVLSDVSIANFIILMWHIPRKQKVLTLSEVYLFTDAYV